MAPAPLNEEAAQYWYNIVILFLFIASLYAATAVAIVLGFKKNWHKFAALRLSQITESHIVPWQVLFGFRLCVLFFCTFVWFWSLVHDEQWNFASLMTWYTIWNFMLLIIYFAAVSLLTVLQRFGFQRPMLTRLLGNFAVVAFNVEVALVFLVDTITWGVLFPALYQSGNTQALTTFSSSIEHGVNILFMTVELLLNRVPMRLFHASWMTLWALIYVVFAELLYFCTEIVTGDGTWRYPFLDLWTNAAIPWYAAVLVLHYVFFILCLVIYMAKVKALKLWFKKKGIPFPDDDDKAEEDDEGVSNSGYDGAFDAEDWS